MLSRDLWVDHPDGRIFVRDWLVPAPRVASPIVLFHDSLGSVELWRDFPALLCAATGRRVIAYDRLGFGRSAALTGRPALDFVAAEAHTVFPVLRAQLGFERFVAFGHSVGGGMAVHCAAAFAADCVALITESAQAFVEERTVQGIKAAREAFRDAGQLQRLGRYHGDKAHWVLQAWIDSWLDPAFADWSLAAVLPQVGCPLLAIHGAEDEYGSVRHPQMIGELSGGPARVEIVEDTFHVPHRECPEHVLALVADFLHTLD